MRVLRHVMGLGLAWGGVGMLTFMLTCGTCACYVTWKATSESAARILASQALNFLKQSPTKKKQCWSPMERRAIHLWVPNLVGDTKLATTLKGSFVSKKRTGNKTILIHTGRVDAMWRLPKSGIPCSLATKVNSQVNPKLMRGVG